jgi:hypothetical protein
MEMENEMMRAFHNNPNVKTKYLNRVMAHAAADEIIKGEHWEKGKGCAVGCTIHSSDHTEYEKQLGIPTWLARVEDKIFEGLPLDKAKEWPTKFLSAIHIGADLEKVKAPFLIFVLESTLDKFDHKKNPQIKTSIDTVIALYKRGDATAEEFRAARDAAATAAAAADYAAAAAAYAAAAVAAAYVDAAYPAVAAAY